MKILKKYILVIAIILPVLIMVTVRSCNMTGFKYDAKKRAMPSFSNSNLVSLNNTEKLSGEKLIVNLDKEIFVSTGTSIPVINIPPGEVLFRKNLRTIKHRNGPVLLHASDPALASRIWMILSQTGIRNIYILTEENDNEAFKNIFRPDTTVRPEL